jgi:signal transduction histidine kinase
MSLFRKPDYVLIAATVLIGAYTLYRLRFPIRPGLAQSDTRTQVIAEQVAVTIAILCTGGWSSPLAITLFPTLIMAIFVVKVNLAAILAGASALWISLQHIVRSPSDDAIQTALLWTSALVLVAVVVNWLHLSTTETAGQQKETLDRVGRLAEANQLLSSLHRVAQVLPASLDLDDVLDSSTDRVRNLLAYDTLTILLVNEATGLLEPVRAHGYRAQDALSDPLLCPPLAEVLQNPAPLRRDFLDSSEGTARLSVSPSGKSGVYVSLRARGAIVGVIAIESDAPRSFSQQHSEVLHGLAEPLGIAIDNARLFRKLRVVGADEERNRIARDLHDRIGSSLASLGFAIDGTLAAARKSQPVVEDLEEIRTYVTGMIGEVREALYDLRSDVDDSMDLASTLKQFADRLRNRSGLTVTFHSDQRIRLPLLQEREIWHIAREAIINVERHAQATAVSITWTSDSERAVLLIRTTESGSTPLHLVPIPLAW